jgi:ferrous iron transport protein B
VVCVVDSTALVRSLFLAAQIADLGLPMVLALNMWDDAKGQGQNIDAELLGQRLGVACIPTSAKTGEGIDELRGAIADALAQGRHMRPPLWPVAVDEATRVLRASLSGTALSDSVLRRILFDSSGTLAIHLGIEETRRRDAVALARKKLYDAGFNPMACEAMLHYRDLRTWTEGVDAAGEANGAGDETMHGHGTGRRGPRHSESIDRLLLHRGWGLLVFVGVMYLVFQAVYSWATPFMAATDWVVGLMHDGAWALLAGYPVLQSLVSDGMIGGIGACLIFLPQILILFMFIAMLEDSGYLPRAAFLMDKMFSWCGLSGKSFVPMLSSYACAVPGIMATRTIKDPKARIATILVAPLMSCSARLPIYVLFIGMFIQPRYGSFYAGLMLFAMHMIGLLVAGPVAFVLTRVILRSKPQPFFLELPPYRVPRVKDVLIRMFERGKVFLRTAGSVIFAMTVIIWALLYFPRPADLPARVESTFAADQAARTGQSAVDVEAALRAGDAATAHVLDHAVESAYVEQSYLGRFGRFIQPVFAPAGFDWKLSVGIVASFPAREVVLSTLGVIYRQGDKVDENSVALRKSMESDLWISGPRAGQPVYTLPMVIALMVFFALCQQCMATVAAIVREAGWGWAVFSFVYMTALAWIGAVAAYQLGSIM